MIGRFITGIIFGFFFRIIIGGLIMFSIGYYFIFHKLPFTGLVSDYWQKAKETTVQVSIGQNGVTNKYDILTESTMSQIDQWLVEKGLNKFGDPKDTVYAGGTPTFNEQTGQLQDRYQLLISKYPELKKISQ